MLYNVHTYGYAVYGRASRVATWGGYVVDATPALKCFVGKPTEDLFSWLQGRNITWEVIPGSDGQTQVGKIWSGKSKST